MCNKFKKIDIKNPTCYFLDDIDIKILVPSKFKIDKKSKKYIYPYSFHWICYGQRPYLRKN